MVETRYHAEELHCVKYADVGNKQGDDAAGSPRDLQLTRQCTPG